MSLQNFFRRVWKDRNPIALGLSPISLLYGSVVALRRLGYTSGLLAVEKFNRPIVVIGNLTVGGTGKTPLTIWVVNLLKRSGYTPGVVSRGYGRRDTATRLVGMDSSSEEVGDEPLVIWRRTGVPVAVAKRRTDAVRLLMKESDCDIFISDDGLQHLAIAADLKILLIDGEERFGNGFCLPAGPLRESKSHAAQCDLVIVNGQGGAGEFSMDCQFVEVTNVTDQMKTCRFTDLADETIVAVAGIRHPERFFAMLKKQGIKSRNLPFPDHHPFSPHELETFLNPAETVLMTEKDAVKCASMASPNWWYVTLEVTPDTAFKNAFLSRVATMVNPHS